MEVTNVVSNVNASFADYGSSRNDRIEGSGASLYWSRKRTKGIMPMGGNADTSGSSSSTRRRLSPDCHNLNTPTPNNTPMSAVNSSSTADSYATVSSSSTAGAAGSSPSTRRRLSADRHNLNTSTLNNSPRPTVNSSSTPIHNSGARKDRTGPPSEYKYIGKCEYSCEHCGARFWYEERIKDTRRRARPAYHRCCMAGRVVIRTYQINPEYIKLLLRDHHFMENIRAYNQMFSMTSLGARIDDLINIGRGPYVFKISGQLYHWLGSLCPAEGDPLRDIVEGLIELLDNHNALVQLFRTAHEKLLDSEVPPFKVRNEYLSGIYDAITRGDSDGFDCGGRLILPQSFTSGPRYMYAHYLDALAICRVHVVYTVEFQKRGLSHCNTLIWVDEYSRIQNHEYIDAYISAELPSKEIDPECHRIVSEFMIHGPYG
ncbi:hypothetical protein Tco_0377698 [Tanacetum coccineum]